MTIPKKKLVTHDGSFHTDDVFAAAVLSLVLEKQGEDFEITRTRNSEIISGGDYVFDVGGVYDAEKNRFDHHQVGGAGRRVEEPKIEYSSVGLVWKKYGESLCDSSAVAAFIDKKLIAPIDSADNGMNLIENKYETSPYFLQHIFISMLPTWKEGNLSKDEMFMKGVALARDILTREIIQAKDGMEASGIVADIYQKTIDKRIIVLDKNYPFEFALKDFHEPLFVIHPKDDGNFTVQAVRSDPKVFKNRKNLPVAWAGLRDEEFQKVSGVTDAIFCHRALFLAVAKSKEGAVKLAQIALES